MKVGDLIKVAPCSKDKDDCECFFCNYDSSRIGLVVRITRKDPMTRYCTLFDCGEWEIFPSDIRHGNVEVISESR